MTGPAAHRSDVFQETAVYLVDHPIHVPGGGELRLALVRPAIGDMTVRAPNAERAIVFLHHRPQPLVTELTEHGLRAHTRRADRERRDQQPPGAAGHTRGLVHGAILAVRDRSSMDLGRTGSRHGPSPLPIAPCPSPIAH